MAWTKTTKSRYAKLRQDGFLKYEAWTLRKVPRRNPFLKEIIKDRRVLLDKSLNEQWSKAAYINTVKNAYRKHKWLDKVGKISAWAMFHKYENKFESQFDWYPY